MKKKISIMLGVMMLTLSACHTSVNVNVPQSSDGQEQNADSLEVTGSDEAKSGDVAETGEEAKSDEVKSSDETENSVEANALPPVYKLIKKYYSEEYKGSNKTDGDGDSLEGKKVYEGMSEALMLTDECKDLYPELYSSLNDAAKEEIKAAGDNADAQIKAATEDADSSFDDKRPFIAPYTDSSIIIITRSDKNVLSYTSDFYSFTGGAHGIYGKYGTTYDVKTGKKLELTDVVDAKEADLIPVLKEKILSTGDPDDFDDLDENLANYSMTGQNGFNWFLDFDGIHFYFGPYEIAAYAVGDTDVVIGYDELPGKVNDEYVPEIKSGYIVSSNIPMYATPYDSDTDTSLHFVCNTDEDAYNDSGYIDCTSLTLKQGDKSATAEDEYFSFNFNDDLNRQYRVVTNDGKEYIYVCALTFDDYTDIIVFDVTGGDIKLAGVYDCILPWADVNTDYSGEYVPTDPDNMNLGTRGQLFGTYSCYGRYVVGAGGLPEFTDKEYKVSWVQDDVKSQKDISVTLLDEEQNEQGSETIPAGTVFTPVCTDNESYMDCRLDDGRMVRLKYSSTDYPVQIDGENVEDLFDGLVYAG